MSNWQKYIAAGFIATVVSVPSIVLAKTFRELTGEILKIGNYIIPLIISLGLVYFLWGVSKYVAPGGDDDKIKEGKNMMIYGIIGLFFMVSVWGLVAIVTQTFFGASTPNSPIQPGTGGDFQGIRRRAPQFDDGLDSYRPGDIDFNDMNRPSNLGGSGVR